MTTSEKLIKIAENVQKVFDAGKSQGGGGDITQNPMYYATTISCWNSATFPDGYELKLHTKNAPNNLTSMFMYSTGLKSVTLVCEETRSIGWLQTFRGCLSVEVFDITNFKVSPNTIQHFANNAKSLVLILGEIDMSNCTNAENAFLNTSALQEIRFKKGTISIALNFKSCTKLSADSYDSIIKGHSKEASVTLTLPAEATVRSVYDAKYGSGAWDAITAQYPNVTIMYS